MMSWKTFVRHCRRGHEWLDLLRRDLRAVFYVPIQDIRREWRARRALHRLIDARLAAFHALPPEEQLGYIHPSSPRKPPGWTLERYKETQRRRRGAH